MYYAVVILLMSLLPAISMAADVSVFHAAFGASLVLKWYVFWAIGWRLSLAGARQVLQPTYTARVILGHKGEESQFVVRELGFANLASGIVGLVGLAQPSWRIPAALSGGVFYALAGGMHVLKAHRNRLENVAMASDLFAAAILLVAFGGVIATRAA